MAYTPSTDFIFISGSYTPSNDFSFGAPIIPGNPSGIIVTTIAGVTGAFGANFTAASGQVGTIGGTLNGLTGLFIARNSFNTGDLVAT